MRNRRVSLLDIGLDSAFDAAMAFVQATIQSINVDYGEPVVDIDFVRSRDPDTVLTAFTASCDVLHVMAHGDQSVTPAFTSSDDRTHISLEELGERAAEQGRGISAGAILADGCRTGTGAWQKAVRDCLQGDVTYIGTSALIGWHESTVFSSAFYGALLRRKGKGSKPADQAREAAERAQRAYQAVTGRRCPFKIVTLNPSRRANTAFA